MRSVQGFKLGAGYGVVVAIASMVALGLVQEVWLGIEGEHDTMSIFLVWLIFGGFFASFVGLALGGGLGEMLTKTRRAKLAPRVALVAIGLLTAFFVAVTDDPIAPRDVDAQIIIAGFLTAPVAWWAGRRYAAALHPDEIPAPPAAPRPEANQVQAS